MKKYFSIIVTIISSQFLFYGCATKEYVITSTEKISGGEISLFQPEEAKNWNLMLGKWYGSQRTTDGGLHEWIVHRFDDGTYEMDFRRTDAAGKIKRTIEVGNWGVSGKIYFIIFQGWIENGVFKPCFPTNYFTRNGYIIKELEETKMVYQQAEGDLNIFTIVKVSDDFEFDS